MARFVLEIGSEEIPARFLKGEREALRRLVADEFTDLRIRHGDIKVMATPRRLTLIVEDLPDTLPKTETVIVGPPASVAYDKDGVPTRALTGFAASNHVGVEDIFIQKTDKGEYVACRKQSGGGPTIDALARIAPHVIQALSFAKSMRWGSHSVSYARPLRWIMALYDDAVVPFEVGPVKAGRETFGHRVHGLGPFTVRSAREYEDVVARQCAVTADQDIRRDAIIAGGNEQAAASGGKVLWKDSLLEEVTGLVEHPVPLLADFDPAYLEIPEEVLLTSMETHQKSFGVRSGNGALLPHFLTVLNMTPPDIGLVKHGWERVLRARLEDARFFWRSDLSESMDDWRKRLDNVIFIGPLGTMGEKSARLASLCQWLAEHLAPEDLSPEQAARAGELAKADLVSAMVGEFDTLQGIMGGIYAARAGEDQAVATAIGEQYLPAGPDTPLPASSGGAILSAADKADTLAGCFGLGMIPTGAADPNGLRRCALGIIRIFINRGWHLDVRKLFAQARELYGQRAWKLDAETAMLKLAEFFEGRLRNYFINAGYETLQVDAVLAAGANNPADAKARLDALAAFGKKPEFAAAAQTLKRVDNIGKKAAEQTAQQWDNALLAENAEKDLAATLAVLLPKLDTALGAGQYNAALASLADLRAPVDAFFDNVLVLCEDAALRENRLKMLNAIRARFARVAQFSALQV